MTPKAQLLAISQIVAPNQQWEIFEDIYIGAKQPYTKMVGFKYPAHRGWILCSPYLADLNAMHEAEKTLDAVKNILPEDEGEETQQQAYFCNLERVVGRDCCEEDIYWYTMHATASQRAEAFLRTFGKWEGE